ncbi:Phosphate-induced protein 1 [Macleaya cordata]|uniref:Phosphate-induced protein 1 n=1 Tax=Macleaya cordata TaxID=56857 RepID=A0A200PXF7_MACCD|nr:Phosphate-induced protein 1 [Macleaya cordata]
MASSPLNKPLLLLTILSLFLLVLPLGSWASQPVVNNPVLKYHNGPILTGQVNLAILWYGRFARETKNILRDFIRSLNSPVPGLDPSVASWWKTVERYQAATSPRGRVAPIKVKIVKQKTDKNYSVGKILTQDFFLPLMDKVRGPGKNYVTVIFTARDVSVAGTCMGRCSRHGVIGAGPAARLYLVVGNPETECPGVCGWPFHRADYGPQTLPLQPPNGNVGADAMVVGLASALAGAVTNPYNNGFFQGPAMNPLEAVNACPGMFGSGSFPGYAGKVLIAPGTGGCFNAHGLKGRKYLLPALWNPDTRKCWTLL